MPEEHRARILDDIAASASPKELDLWPAIQAQIVASNPASTADRISSRRTWTRRTIVGGAAVAMLATVAGVTYPLWSPPEPVNAQEILDRAQASASATSSAVATYHLLLTRQIPGKENTTITSEMWYGGHDRQRSDTQIKDARGKILTTQEVIFSGNQTWIVSTENGKSQIVHTTGTTWTEPVQAPIPQASVSDLLRQYASNKGCMGATLAGLSSIARRPSYVIALQFRPNGCGGPAGRATPDPYYPKAVLDGRPGADLQNQVNSMTVWVDTQTYLPLKTEVRNGANALLDQSEVTSIVYNVSIPDSTFSYTPPPGAVVANFTGGTGADVKRSLYGSSPVLPQK